MLLLHLQYISSNCIDIYYHKKIKKLFNKDILELPIAEYSK